MARRLPPLNALRAFESAARHLSFAKAAEELNVTPAAISHQIKGLEAQLGVKLFRRANRAIWLTEAGQACLPDLRDGFDRLAQGIERLRSQQSRGVLTVSAAPGFAGKWLVSRLDRFRSANPEIDVRLDASTQMSDFDRDGVDIAIRYGLGKYEGVDSKLLLCEEVSPVCSPRLVDGDPPLREPGDLRHHTLLHDAIFFHDEPFPDWRMWLAAAGVRDMDTERGPRFSSSEHALQAAIDGHGVALGRSVMAESDIEAGRLVRPFALSYPVSFAYYVVAPYGWRERPKVAAFARWLLAEAGVAWDEDDENDPGAEAGAEPSARAGA
jgi:LysR family glycine cleavage system transcriptional activator